VESTGIMAIAKHKVFAQPTVGGKTLEQMTRHNERAFDHRTSPSAPTDKIYMPYVWITCQEVSQVILSHNLLVQVSVRVCSSAYTHLIKVLDKTQPVKAGQEPLGAFGTRGRWTRCITATSSSSAGKQVVGEQIGRNGVVGRQTFPVCYVRSARRHTEHIQGLYLMLSQFFLSVFFSVALSLKSILLCASVDRWCQETLLL